MVHEFVSGDDVDDDYDADDRLECRMQSLSQCQFNFCVCIICVSSKMNKRQKLCSMNIYGLFITIRIPSKYRHLVQCAKRKSNVR